MKKCIGSFLLVLAVMAVSFGIAHARGEYLTIFNEVYETNGTKDGETLGSCITCHPELNGKGGYNLYGDDLEAADIKNYPYLALERTEILDSDKDGYPTLEEINAGTFPGDPESQPGESTNTPPISDAGADQTVLTGATVTLDGSGSGDADSDPLSFSWSLVSRPQGSTAALSDPGAVNPVFDVDLPGTYVVQLLVNDGMVDSAPDEVTVSTRNSAPVADAGPDRSVFVGDAVTLDGSNSSDVDGNSLSFNWSFVSVPSGSDAVISDPTAIMPAFTVDVFGTYVVQLIVNDGSLSSAADTVTISTINSVPVADAGPDQTVSVGTTVTLDGSGSGDTDGDVLTFNWSLTSIPAGSAAALSDPTAINPGFALDMPGTYVVQLIVNDGRVDSAPDTVTIGTNNSVPIAEAGADQTVTMGNTVTLDGSASSDVDGDPLSFSWSIASRPDGSSAVLSDPAAVNPTFVVDSRDTYVVQLIVHDGRVDSAPDTVTIGTNNSVPLADAGADQTVTMGNTVTLDGSASSDVDGDPLNFSWSIASRPDGSSAVLSDPAAVNPTFVVDSRDTYVVQLIVNDGRVDSAPATVTIGTNNSVPIAEAGADQTVTMGNTVTLDGSASSDVDGDPLSFSWSFVSRPQGSSAVLSDPAAVNPTFVVDSRDTYVVQLIVHDGRVDSAPASVTIGTNNSVPLADAGADQTVTMGNTVTLDGSASSDLDGDPLSFSWSIASRPDGSSAALFDPAAVNPTFVADLPGTYVAQLFVNDGKVDSAPHAVTISTVNSDPVADAGKRLRANIGETITLDGSKSSDADNDTLGYSWSLTSGPTGSTAVLSDPTAVNPSLAADLAGTYVVQLIVNDGNSDSIPDSCLVKVFKSGNRGNGGSKGNGKGKDPGGAPGSGSQ